jgi:pimeloyl-ACP methyl ester carboxylesterase
MDSEGDDSLGPALAAPIPSGRAEVHRKRASRNVLLTTDGVRIVAEHRPSAGRDDLAIVVAHGFSGALERPAVRRVAEEFRAYAGVVTFSFRGHGDSGGRSTVGDRETLDVDAAVAWARRLGYRTVATVGFSMGGSVVLRHAGSGPAAHARTDAVVSVSAPARWYYRGTAPMRRLHWVVTRPVGRAVSRYGLRTRIHPEDWNPVPLSPVESVPFIAPTPLLIVHGDRDGYFPLDHPLSLARAASGGTADLWIERGFGHAENAASPRLLRRIGAWVRTHAVNRAEPAHGRGELPPEAVDASSWTAREA